MVAAKQTNQVPCVVGNDCGLPIDTVRQQAIVPRPDSLQSSSAIASLSNCQLSRDVSGIGFRRARIKAPRLSFSCDVPVHSVDTDIPGACKQEPVQRINDAGTCRSSLSDYSSARVLSRTAHPSSLPCRVYSGSSLASALTTDSYVTAYECICTRHPAINNEYECTCTQHDANGSTAILLSSESCASFHSALQSLPPSRSLTTLPELPGACAGRRSESYLEALKFKNRISRCLDETSSEPAPVCKSWLEGCASSAPVAATGGGAVSLFCAGCGHSVTLQRRYSQSARTSRIKPPPAPTCGSASDTKCTGGRKSPLSQCCVLSERVPNQQQQSSHQTIELLAGDCNDLAQARALCQQCSVKNGVTKRNHVNFLHRFTLKRFNLAKFVPHFEDRRVDTNETPCSCYLTHGDVTATCKCTNEVADVTQTISSHNVTSKNCSRTVGAEKHPHVPHDGNRGSGYDTARKGACAGPLVTADTRVVSNQDGVKIDIVTSSVVDRSNTASTCSDKLSPCCFDRQRVKSCLATLYGVCSSRCNSRDKEDNEDDVNDVNWQSTSIKTARCFSQTDVSSATNNSNNNIGRCSQQTCAVQESAKKQTHRKAFYFHRFFHKLQQSDDQSGASSQPESLLDSSKQVFSFIGEQTASVCGVHVPACVWARPKKIRVLKQVGQTRSYVCLSRGLVDTANCFAGGAVSALSIVCALVCVNYFMSNV